MVFGSGRVADIKKNRVAASFWALAILALAACDTGYVPPPRLKDRSMPDLPDVQTRLAFTCVTEKERIPPRDPEADQLYAHARWLKKNNLLKEDPSVYPTIERLIRVATAYGHDKANLELRQMIGKGQAVSDDPVKETLDLTEDLIKRGIPGGYYDMGRYLERGYGLKKDHDLARKYYRKAADLGNPEAQYAVGEMLAPIDNAPEIARQMRKCAGEQGHGKVALALGINLKNNGRYSEALQAFQLAAKGGDPSGASFLSEGFKAPPRTILITCIFKRTRIVPAATKQSGASSPTTPTSTPKSPRSTGSFPCHRPSCPPGTASCNG